MTSYMGVYKTKIADLEGSGFCKNCLRVGSIPTKVRNPPQEFLR